MLPQEPADDSMTSKVICVQLQLYLSFCLGERLKININQGVTVDLNTRDLVCIVEEPSSPIVLCCQVFINCLTVKSFPRMRRENDSSENDSVVSPSDSFPSNVLLDCFHIVAK